MYVLSFFLSKDFYSAITAFGKYQIVALLSHRVLKVPYCMLEPDPEVGSLANCQFSAILRIGYALGAIFGENIHKLQIGRPYISQSYRAIRGK